MFASLLITLIAIPFGSAVPAGPVALIERDGGYQFKGQATWYDDSVGLGVSHHLLGHLKSSLSSPLHPGPSSSTRSRPAAGKTPQVSL